jgi:iron complex transport system substrate-binding protein
VRSGEVYVADGNRFFNRSGPTVFETIPLLAEILHPGVVPRVSEGTLYRRW